MADVCGKGPRAAALTALIRHTLRAEIGHDLAPAAALRRLNRAMLLASAAVLLIVVPGVAVILIWKSMIYGDTGFVNSLLKSMGHEDWTHGWLSHPRTVLWVTPHGRFADARERPLALKPGVGHLAATLGRGAILPMAVELTFWDERTPGQARDALSGELEKAS